MSKIYLKKILSINLPYKLVYNGFKAKYPQKKFVNGKPTEEIEEGKFEYLHIFSSAEYPDIALYASEYEHNDLSAFQPGDRLTVCKQEKKREGKPSFFNLIFALEGDAMESVVEAPPPMTPTQGRKVNAAVDAQKIKEVAISLQGFAQQILPLALQGIGTENSLGLILNVEEAVEMSVSIAAKARKAVLDKAIELANPKPEIKQPNEEPSDIHGNLSYVDSLQ